MFDKTSDRKVSKVAAVWTWDLCRVVLVIVLMISTTMAADIPPLAPDPSDLDSNSSLAPVTVAPVTTPVTTFPTALNTSDSLSPVAVAANVSVAPATIQPVSQAPITKAPITRSPVTRSPVSSSPVTPIPVTLAPVIPEVDSPIPTSYPSQLPTAAPSPSPTSPPTSLKPSPAPTPSPVDNKSASPSVAPSAELSVTVSDRFSVKQFSVASKMSKQNSEFFRNTTQQFLGDMFGQLDQPITDVTIQVVGQTLIARRRLQLVLRNLQDRLLPLSVEMTVQGSFIPEKGGATTAGDVNLGELSQQFFEEDGSEFVALLQAATDPEDVSYFATVEEVTPVAGTGDGPSAAPATTTKSTSILTTGAIIAIAVGGALAMALLLVLLCQQSRKKKNLPESLGDGESRAGSAPAMFAPSSSRPSEVQSSSYKPMSTQSGTFGEGYNSSNYEDNYSDIQSQAGMDTLAGADTMSYAYSLDHGIEGSIISAPSSDYTGGGYSTSGSSIPTEIPMVSTAELRTNPAEDTMSQSNKITRECFAPPGRLGIIIDTTVEGPVIHKVNPGSPLEGIVWPGDVIIAIDDSDTRALSANEITALMAKNMNHRRKLTIMSEA